MRSPARPRTTCSPTTTACSKWTVRWAARRHTTHAPGARPPRRAWPSGWCRRAKTFVPRVRRCASAPGASELDGRGADGEAPIRPLDRRDHEQGTLGCGHRGGWLQAVEAATGAGAGQAERRAVRTGQSEETQARADDVVDVHQPFANRCEGQRVAEIGVDPAGI